MSEPSSSQIEEFFRSNTDEEKSSTDFNAAKEFFCTSIKQTRNPTRFIFKQVSKTSLSTSKASTVLHKFAKEELNVTRAEEVYELVHKSARMQLRTNKKS